jgi:hypothetical protein
MCMYMLHVHVHAHVCSREGAGETGETGVIERLCELLSSIRVTRNGVGNGSTSPIVVFSFFSRRATHTHRAHSGDRQWTQRRTTSPWTPHQPQSDDDDTRTDECAKQLFQCIGIGPLALADNLVLPSLCSSFSGCRSPFAPE